LIYCGQFWRPRWRRDSQFQNLWRNLKMFFRRMAKKSSRDCSKLLWVHSKKDCGCIEGRRRWSSTMLIKKYVQYL
jgi:hypothetical protein